MDSLHSATASSMSATPSGSSAVPTRKRRSIAYTPDPEAEFKKKEREVVFKTIESAMERLNALPSPNKIEDDFDLFGKFVASELRSLKDPVYAKSGQRQLNKLLLNIMENEPVQSISFLYVNYF